MSVGRLPDFVYCGYPRTGSSFLRYCLGEHPEISFLESPRFFNVDANYAKGIEHYRSLLDGLEARRILGDGDINYLSAEGSRFAEPEVIAERIHTHLPDARIVICIRNQTDFLLSGYRYWKRSGLSGTFDAYMEGWPEGLVPFAEIADYVTILSRYHQLFGADRIKVLLYEDLVEDEAAFLEGAFSFLGVRTSCIPSLLAGAGTYRQINPSASRQLSQLFDRLNVIRMKNPRLLRYVLPVRLYRLLAAVEHKIRRPSIDDARKELTSEQQERINQRYARGNTELAALLGVDLARRGYPCN